MQHGLFVFPHLELHIPTDAVGTTGSLYAQDYIIRGIAHCELRLNDAPLLLDWSNDSAWWRWHLKALWEGREERLGEVKFGADKSCSVATLYAILIGPWVCIYSYLTSDSIEVFHVYLHYFSKPWGKEEDMK